MIKKVISGNRNYSSGRPMLWVCANLCAPFSECNAYELVDDPTVLLNVWLGRWSRIMFLHFLFVHLFLCYYQCCLQVWECVLSYVIYLSLLVTCVQLKWNVVWDESVRSQFIISPFALGRIIPHNRVQTMLHNRVCTMAYNLPITCFLFIGWLYIVILLVL